MQPKTCATSKGSPTDAAAAAWRSRAEELAAWTAGRVVNRADAWGGYRPDSHVTLRGQVTRSLLVRHFRARRRAEITGLHSASADNLAKWGAIDIDWHGPESTAPGINLEAALWWYRELGRRGFRPLLTTSNGKGGYHLRVLLAEAVPAD